MTAISSGIRLEEWELPPMMPREVDGLSTVGVPLPNYPTPDEFSEAWYHYDPLNWNLDELNRREWETEILSNFDQWKRYLDFDSTPIFKKTIQQKRAKGGILVGIKGIKGGGKSRLAQMVIERIAGVRPHVLFQYKDVEAQVQAIEENQEVALLIDEDLTATGSDSANLVVHINNSWDTNRKAIQSGVCTGVNLSFERWGNTLDLRLEPCGINPDFLATRFGMFSSKDKFLGWGALQFKHLPDDIVYYYDKIGTWREYDERASIFSRGVTRTGGAMGAVDSITQTKHINKLRLAFKARYVDKGLTIPPDIACRRIYRAERLPPKSIGYMNEVIWWAKDEIDKEGPTRPVFVPEPSQGWNGLRTLLKGFIMQQKIKQKTANYLCDWYVSIGLKQSEIGAKYGVGRDAVNTAVRRHKDIFRGHETALAKMAEHWLATHADTLGPELGSGGKGSHDILMRIGEREVAVNVKWALTEPKYRRDFDSTPENKLMPFAYLAIVNSIRNQIRLYAITGTQTYAKWDLGVPCAPEEFADRLTELVEK